MVRRLEKKHDALLFVTDIHGRVVEVQKIISHIKKTPVDAIILGGDIPGTTKKSFHDILRPLSKLDVPVIVIPGSHEPAKLYDVVSRYPVIDTTKKRNWLIRYGEQELVFLPGSDVTFTGTFRNDGGSYHLMSGLSPAQKTKRTRSMRSRNISQIVEYYDMEEIRDYVKKYSKIPGSQKLVFSHVPLFCKSKKGIDLAQFYMPTKAFEFDGYTLEPGIDIISAEEAQYMKNYPIVKKQKNVGNNKINDFMRSLRCMKFFCGHIHEAGKRAIDTKENKVRPGKETKELYLNSGEGVLTRIEFPSKNTVSYRLY